MILALLAALALAQEAPPRAWGPAATEVSDVRGEDMPLEAPREVPDLDGREEPAPTAGQTVLWAPRLVLAPLYLVERYVVYPPLRAFGIWVEKNNVPVRLYEGLTFGNAHTVTFLPTAFVDFGFRPSVGLRAIYRAPSEVADGGATVLFGGQRWFVASATLTRHVGRADLTFGALFSDRPDWIFYGVGPVTLEDRTRYRRRQMGGGVRGALHLGHADEASLATWVERDTFDDGTDRLGDPTIGEVFDTGDIPGFESGYTLAEARLRLTLDSRARRPAPGTGARGELLLGAGTDLTGRTGGFVRYGATGSLFLDVTGGNRTFELRQYVDLVDPLADGSVPFTELVGLGGEHLRGFRGRELIGRSAAVTTVQYMWPVWVYLDAVLFTEVGNAFGPQFERFALGELRGSAGVGIRSLAPDRRGYQLLLAVGTTELGHAVEIDAVRLVIGSEPRL